jgi:hypothetical protein
MTREISLVNEKINPNIGLNELIVNLTYDEMN